MLVNLRIHPVANPQIFESPAHRAHAGGLANLDVGFRRECNGDLPSIVERDDGKALCGIKLANLTLDQQPHPLPAELMPFKKPHSLPCLNKRRTVQIWVILSQWSERCQAQRL